MMQGVDATKRWTLFAAVVGSSMVFLDSTVVTVALPRIGQDLPTHILGVLEGQSYVFTGYLLTLSALLVIGGAAADTYGRRRMFAWGLGAFAATSALCGMAPTMEALVLFRVLQGAAGALLVPGSLALITATFDESERGRAFGFWAGASAATTILGPLIGGLLVDTASWRGVFFINVPFALLALWACLRHVPESHDPESQLPESHDTETAGRLDWLGAAFVALAVGGLAFGGIYGQERNWQDPAAFVILGVGALATVALVPLMTRRAHPLVPPALFRSRNFTVTNIATLLIYGALYVTLYLLALHLQGVLGYSATAAGLATVPATLPLALFASKIGALADRIGATRPFMTAGPIVMALGVLWLVRMPADSEPWRIGISGFRPPTGYLVDVLPAMIVFGVGIMLLVAPLTATLMASVPVRNAGVASAVNNAISRVGPQLAGAAVFIAVTAAFYSGLEARVADLPDRTELREVVAPLNPPSEDAPEPIAAASAEASTEALHLAMLCAAGMLLAGAAVSGFGIADRRDAAIAAEPPLPEPGLG